MIQTPCVCLISVTPGTGLALLFHIVYMLQYLFIAIHLMIYCYTHSLYQLSTGINLKVQFSGNIFQYHSKYLLMNNDTMAFKTDREKVPPSSLCFHVPPPPPPHNPTPSPSYCLALISTLLYRCNTCANTV